MSQSWNYFKPEIKVEIEVTASRCAPSPTVSTFSETPTP
jgi:hypothetical protein